MTSRHAPRTTGALNIASSADAGVTITECEREPIRSPGAIQPHGVLLVLRARDLVVVQASANTGSVIGQDTQALLGNPVSILLGPAQTDAMARQLERLKAQGEERGDVPLRFTLAVNGATAPFSARIFRDAMAGLVLLEMEPGSTHDALSLYGFHARVRQTLGRIRNTKSLKALAQAVADEMRVLTGYDRIWVYRFHPDWHGEIIAESRRDDIESWLGLHYPASDIPGQARALFLEHPLRVIADVDYEAVPLVPVTNSVTGGPLDLGGALLRSVSPVHLEYMRNMGVRASLVISIVRDGALWGLASGHHYSGPKTLPYEQHTICEFLGEAFALQLASTEGAEDRERMQHARSVEGRLVELLSECPAADALTASDITMMDLVESDGAALATSTGISRVGALPDHAFVRRLVAWLDHSIRPDDPVARSYDSLAGVYSAAEDCPPSCSGLLAVPVFSAARTSAPPWCWLLWFRGERVQSLRWGGDPAEKPVRRETDGTVRLSPRGSFAVWEQEVRGTSLPWTAAEREAAESLSRILHLVPEAHWTQPVSEARQLRTAVAALRTKLTVATPAVPRDIQVGFDMLSYRVDALVAALSEFSSVVE